ncbi:RrF2 family transcriptional regulator [Marinicauda salina]|nr:Rrf2 family transcriptional regulator [Marinicauda salina]
MGMRLTNFSNYALRLLQFAALRAPEHVRVEDVARAHGISRHHLLKAANTLSRHDFVTVIRGRGGGVKLARPPAAITVGAVVRVTEGPIELVECFNAETNTCPLRGVCRLSRALDAALESFLQSLDSVTIADIAANRGDLLRRLAPAQE